MLQGIVVLFQDLEICCLSTISTMERLRGRWWWSLSDRWPWKYVLETASIRNEVIYFQKCYKNIFQITFMLVIKLTSEAIPWRTFWPHRSFLPLLIMLKTTKVSISIVCWQKFIDFHSPWALTDSSPLRDVLLTKAFRSPCGTFLTRSFSPQKVFISIATEYFSWLRRRCQTSMTISCARMRRITDW